MKPLAIAKLPSPPKSIFKVLGPSFILIGLGLGTGELILWPYLVSNWGLGIIWGAALGITMQFFLNMEIERYTLANGESVFVGFARLFRRLPFWFIGSTLIAFSWPGFSAVSAQILTPFFQTTDITYIGIAMLLAVGVILTFAPVLYKTVETFQKVLIMIGIPVIIIIVARVANTSDFIALSKGLIGVGDGYMFFPKTLPFMSFLAAFAYSGAGGNLNLAQSFYIKEKGYGMGKYSGRITSLITGKKEHVQIEGTTFEVNSDEIKKFNKWWKLTNIEHAVVFWGLGLLTILLLAVLSHATVLGMENNSEGINFIFNQTNVVKGMLGSFFSTSLLLVTALMLFSTQLAVIDASGRIVAENVALISRKNTMDLGVSKMYYLTIWILLFFGVLIYLSGFNQPRTLIIIGALLNAFCMFVFSGLLNKLNTKLLPKEIQPSNLRKGIVYLTFFFFGVFSILVFLNNVL